MRHPLNFSTLILVLRGFSALQFKLFCNKETLHFFNFNTYSRISLCAREHYLRYVEGKHQCHRIAFWDFYFVLFRENNDFGEFMFHLMRRNLFPLLHNTVLILCDEEDGLVAMN